MKRVVVFSGSGISAESGIKTFRDSGGLWEEFNIEDVATPEAWRRNPELVLDFYNKRRKQMLEAQPNIAHKTLVELEKKYDVSIITQNVDDLHERAGSKKVLHIHGELRKARSTMDPSLIYKIEGWELKKGDKCTKGSQLRPHIVWFGEAVTEMEKAISISTTADVFIVVGTSLNVYPAAGLIDFVPSDSTVYIVDPNAAEIRGINRYNVLPEKAGTGIPKIVNELLKNNQDV